VSRARASFIQALRSSFLRAPISLVRSAGTSFARSSPLGPRRSSTSTITSLVPTSKTRSRLGFSGLAANAAVMTCGAAPTPGR
jgi:hypothetical protein